MSYQFLTRPLTQGSYEPEGIYLTLPLDGECRIVQSWGGNASYYAAYRYNGVPLKGHNGIDFVAETNAPIFAVDSGRVMGMGYEPEGYGRYLKLAHSWGESFYAHLGKILVDAGQLVQRKENLATVEGLDGFGNTTYLHFGLRIKLYNRFDGWGGFVDPIPYLEPTHLRFAHAEEIEEPTAQPFIPHPMLHENDHPRRP